MTLDEMERKARVLFTAYFSKRAEKRGMADPYTIVFRQPEVSDGVRYYGFLSASADCSAPQGVGLYETTRGIPIDRMRKPNIGRRIKFHMLPKMIQRAILEEVNVTLEEELPL